MVSDRLDLTAQVMEVVADVRDPHLWLGLGQMGMIDRVDVDEDGRVEVALCYPCLGCPATEMIESSVRNRVGKLDGVTEVKVIRSWRRTWSKDDLDPAAVEPLREFGIQV